MAGLKVQKIHKDGKVQGLVSLFDWIFRTGPRRNAHHCTEANTGRGKIAILHEVVTVVRHNNVH